MENKNAINIMHSKATPKVFDSFFGAIQNRETREQWNVSNKNYKKKKKKKKKKNFFGKFLKKNLILLCKVMSKNMGSQMNFQKNGFEKSYETRKFYEIRFHIAISIKLLTKKI